VCAAVQRLDGVISADLNFASATLLVEYDPANDPRERIVREVESSGHGLTTLDEEANGGGAPERAWYDTFRTEIATGGSGVFALVGAVLSRVGAPHWAAVAAFAVAIAFGGFLVWRRALLSLRARMLDMNVLMTVAVFGAAAIGQWGEAATVYFLFALGGLLESRSLERTRRSIRDLIDLAPPTARVRRDGAIVEVQAADVAIAEVVVVRPGERVPLDGTVTAGSSAVDEAAITGESVPAEKSVGDAVYAGTLNTSGLLDVRVSAPAADSTLARIVYMVEEAQASRAPSQTFVDRFSRIYTPTVVAFAVAIALVPPAIAFAFGLDWGGFGAWFQRALVMLVVSCPCALVLSTPVAIVSGVTRASRDGVLVKGGIHLETASRVQAIAFDKTGTLTHGRPEVGEVVAFSGRTRDDVLAVAAALESHSAHPIARAVVRAAARVDAREVSNFVETPGRGVRGLLGGVEHEICSPACAAESGLLGEAMSREVERVEARGMTVLVLIEDGSAAGVIGVADEVRESATQAVAQLKELGVSHLVMLTGDNELVAEAVAEKAGLTGVLARLLPQAKTEAVGVLKQRYQVVAMVGDGVNDAPALAAADLGIAMGAAGSDTALETADVALMSDDLSALPGFIELGRRTMRVIHENVWFSIAVKFVVLALAIVGRATLWMAVFADMGVSLLVILNGMRLLRKGRASRRRSVQVRSN
jgi:Cd2+/Zn2+-exporting ATPase